MNQFLDKISHIFNRQAVRWLLLSLTTFVLLLYFVPPQYATNDDMNLIFLANGGLSYPSSHLVYSNIILGSILKHLFTAIPSVNWFTLISLGAYFASFYAFTYLLRFKYTMFSLTLFEIVTYLITLVSYNYTSVAIAIALFSSFVLLFGFTQTKCNKLLLTLCSGLLMLSSWIRFDSFGFALLLCAPFFIHVFIRLLKNKYYQRIGICALLLASIGGTYILDKQAYKNDSFIAYKQYEDILHTINDYEYIPDYSTKYADNADFYVSQGISVNSFDLLRHYTYADDSVFSFNRLNAIADHIDQTAFSINDLGTKLAGYFASPLHLIWLCVVIIISIYLFLNRHEKYNGLMLISIAIGCVIALAYIHLNRYPDRIGFALPLVCMVYGLLQMKVLTLPTNSFVMLLYLAYSLYTISSYNPVSLKKETNWINDLTQLNQDDQSIYLYDGFSPLLSLDYSFNFYTMQVPSIDNTYRLGGWLYKLPANEDILVRNGIDNPFAALIEQDNVYLASNDIGSEKVLTYIKENINDCVEVFIEKEYSNFNVYKYQIKD